MEADQKRITRYFKEKVVIVTGAAKGMGAALCNQLAAAGAVIFAADIDEKGLQAVAGPNIHPMVANVTRREEVAGLFNYVLGKHNRIDMVFNNAGIAAGGDFENMSPPEWEKIVSINFWGVVYGTQEAYNIMVKQRYGHIVNTASSAGLLPVPKSTAYAATKHAVVGLSVSLREEGKRHGVRVSTVAPGLVDTSIFSSAVNIKGYNYDSGIAKIKVRKISPEHAAKIILTGTAKNKRMIVFPLYNRLLTFFYGICPGFASCLIRKNIA